MNCLIFPEEASDYKCFVVDNSEAVSAIGVDIHDAKRDRYAYNELKAGREKLFQLAGDYSQKEKVQRTPVEQQVINLANNFHEFEALIHFFDVALVRFTATGDTETAKAFPEKDGVTLSVALERVPAIIKSLQSKRDALRHRKTERGSLRARRHHGPDAPSADGHCAAHVPLRRQEREGMAHARGTLRARV